MGVSMQRPKARQVTTEELTREISNFIAELDRIPVPDLKQYKHVSQFRGCYYLVDLKDLARTDPKDAMENMQKLMESLYNQAENSGANVVLRSSMKQSGGKYEFSLNVSRSYTNGSMFIQPDKDVLQELVDKAVKEGKMPRKGYAYYFNYSMGLIAKVNNGRIVEENGRPIVFPASGPAIELYTIEEIRTLHGKERSILKMGPTIKGAEDGVGWNIPPYSRPLYKDLVSEHPESFNGYSVNDYSFFNMMGPAKISFEGPRMLHTRNYIFPGTTIKIPLGSEAGLIDDPHNQSTHGCIYVAEGSFKYLYDPKRNSYVFGNDVNIREQDIGVLIREGKLVLRDVSEGDPLKLRKELGGGLVRLSKDNLGNPTWVNGKNEFIGFNRVNFDWNDAEMPQVVFVPAKPSESSIFQDKFTAGKTVYVDNRMHYIRSEKDQFVLAIFPDRAGMFERDEGRRDKIFRDIMSEMLDEGYVVSGGDEANIVAAINSSKNTPVIVYINKRTELAAKGNDFK